MEARPLEFDCPDDVRRALDGIGRVEDVRFSPDGRLLVLAGYARNRLLLLDVTIGSNGRRPTVGLTGSMTIESPDLREPHGIDFLDPKTLVVGNRKGAVVVVILPSPGRADGGAKVRAHRIPRRSSGSPGSVVSRPVGRWQYDVLVCNNYQDRVTRHRLDRRLWLRSVRNEVLLKRGLELPDGIALAGDGRWIAVSSHETHRVLVYEFDAHLGPDTAPIAALEDIDYPHGLRFTPDGRYLLVADAGRPSICVFRRATSWREPPEWKRAVTIMDAETFALGASTVAEGGPKGIDFDPDQRVLAVTAEFRSLAFFALGDLLGPD